MSVYITDKNGKLHRVAGNEGSAHPYPVNSIYISLSNTSPARTFGGVWEQIKDCFLWATGDIQSFQRYDSSSPAVWITENLTSGSYGGEMMHYTNIWEIPEHTHSINHDHGSFSAGSGEHTHTIWGNNRENAGSQCVKFGKRGATECHQSLHIGETEHSVDGSHSHTIDVPSYSGTSGKSGGATPVSNMPPYLAVYIWKRIA